MKLHNKAELIDVHAKINFSEFPNRKNSKCTQSRVGVAIYAAECLSDFLVLLNRREKMLKNRFRS